MGKLSPVVARQGLLRTALEELNIPYKVAAGEGAFYGPKIDIHVPNVERRLWQIGTLQVFHSRYNKHRKY